MSSDAQAESEPQRRRVPNAERTATTRAKLIEATIQTLYELGYHQTTTVLVAKRAGVSRGAMLHHFPTKADLIMATAEHIRVMRRKLHKARLSVFDTPKEKFLALVDVLWEAMVSPSGVARLEIMLSARSDPEMAKRIEQINDEIDRSHKDRTWRLGEDMGLDASKHRERFDAFVQLYAAAGRGLSIDALREHSRTGANKSIELLKTFQKQMIEDMLADVS
ncbi:TetR/AcrR family transcriptional regulator [Henriciella sp. AS95]|uniref:TetR/AcrR family transcriptional regulator n=1 Tax=Henriciella sp. AS95 TaxID=3135782 RepID=UPI00317FAE19